MTKTFKVKVTDEIVLQAQNCNFIQENFMPWITKASRSAVCNKMVHHAFTFARNFLTDNGCYGEVTSPKRHWHHKAHFDYS